MISVYINKGWRKVGDNGLLAQNGIAKAIDESIERLHKDYPYFEHFRMDRSVKNETIFLMLNEDIKPYLGIEDKGNLYFCTHIHFELGRGKKNLENNSLTVDTYFSAGANKNCYAYSPLKAKFNGNTEVARHEIKLTIEMIKDPELLVKTVHACINEGIEKMRKAWREIQDGQTARDIDYCDVAPHIKEIFANNGVTVNATLSNELEYSEVRVVDPDESVSGSLNLKNAGEGWYIDNGAYEFNFVNEIFDLSQYRVKSYIKDEKFDELIGMIAKEYKRERDMAKQFKAIREQFVNDTENKKSNY